MKNLPAFLALAITCAASGAWAEDAPNYSTDTLTGNWGGARQSLADHGMTVDAVYKADVFSNTTGGIKTGTRALDNMDLMINLDGEKLAGLKGTTALIHFLNNFGRKPDADLVGSGQGIDSIETSEPAAKLYQAWVQQSLFDDKVSVLGGLYDLNSEFYVNEPALLFIEPTYGIGTDIAQSGVNGPSIFPTTALAARIKVQPTKEWYAQAVLLDGIPGDPNDAKGTHIDLDKEDGGLVVAEAGYIPGGENPEGKFGVGAWWYSKKAPDLTDVDANGNPVMHNNEGIYVIADHSLYKEGKDSKKGLAGFARLGFANEDVNQFNYAWAVGLVYTGAIPTRDDGQLGFAVNGAHNSSKFTNASETAGNPVDSQETAFELTYNDHITPWFALQPDIQYIIDPGTNPASDNALIVGGRAIINF